jgi:hypothetical protein
LENFGNIRIIAVLRFIIAVILADVSKGRGASIFGVKKISFEMWGIIIPMTL